MLFDASYTLRKYYAIFANCISKCCYTLDDLFIEGRKTLESDRVKQKETQHHIYLDILTRLLQSSERQKDKSDELIKQVALANHLNVACIIESIVFR